MAKKRKQSSKSKKVAVAPEKELECFAGSSDEEGEKEDQVLDQGDDVEVDDKEDDVPQQQDDHRDDDGLPDDDEYDASNVDDLDDADDDEVRGAAAGMASAMARILGTEAKPGTNSVVLSKTTTPLQRLAQKEKERLKEAKEKRRSNRERNLTALHVPLSVATSRTNTHGSSSSSLVQELELERTHRRVATRGVVALFNAIAKHQQEAKGETVTKAATKTEVKKMTKHGFLDMIKSAAASNNDDKDEDDDKTTDNRSATKPQWNALKDDYMLNSSLKDWDQQSSEEEEQDSEIEDNFDDTHNAPAPEAKRGKVSSRR